MPPEPPIDEENYASSEDSDFAPEDVPEHVSSADSESEAEAAHDGEQTATAPSRRPEGAAPDDGAEAEDAGFENSGDEAVIGRGKKRKRRRQDRDQQESGGEEGGGTGGFVKTRRQRANEKAERRAAAVCGPVTVDVDALWAQMTAGPEQEQQQQKYEESGGLQNDLLDLGAVAAAAAAAVAATTAAAAAASRPGDNDDGGDMVKIRRTYNFAGKVHTEEKLVARDSAEAKLYLASLASGPAGAASSAGAAGATAEDSSDSGGPERPPPRKAFRSVFEPVIPVPQSISAQSGGGGGGPSLRRADLDLGVRARLQARERAAQEKAKKLNTVEMSRMDWAGFVDKEGIQDELALAGKAKGSYVERQLFLARSEAIREEEARRARLANKV